MFFTVSPHVDQLVLAPWFQPAWCAGKEWVFHVDIRCDLQSPLDIWKLFLVELIRFQEESGGYPTVKVYCHPGRSVDGARESATRFGFKEQFIFGFLYQFHFTGYRVKLLIMLIWRRLPCAITKARISSNMIELFSARDSFGQPCVNGRLPFVWIENPPRVVSILRIELPFRSIAFFSFIFTGYRVQESGTRCLAGFRSGSFRPFVPCQ